MLVFEFQVYIICLFGGQVNLLFPFRALFSLFIHVPCLCTVNRPHGFHAILKEINWEGSISMSFGAILPSWSNDINDNIFVQAKVVCLCNLRFMCYRFVATNRPWMVDWFCVFFKAFFYKAARSQIDNHLSFLLMEILCFVKVTWSLHALQENCKIL